MKISRIVLLPLMIILLFSCTQKEKPLEMSILIRMMDSQDLWFREELGRRALDELNLKLNFITFNDLTEIELLLRSELEMGQNSIGLIKTHFTVLSPLVEKNFIVPLNSILGKEELNSLLNIYIEPAVQKGIFDNKTYYIPRKLEVNTLLYLPSKVNEALSLWPVYKNEIEELFRKQNSRGLPAGFQLENDPNEWDWYDLAAVSYIWSRVPDEKGRTMARMAHRAKDYEGTTYELLTKVYQAGGNPDDFLRFDGPSILDTLEWEAFFVENNLYNPKMWEESWSGGGIWNGMEKGEVYAAFMHQLDSFFIHGGTHKEMKGYLENPDDMAVALMPAGVSLDLDENNRPLRQGDHFSATGGWWWGIPQTSPDRELSLKLIELITSVEFHKEEYLTFGMLPVRKDIYDDLNSHIDQPWQKNVFSVGLDQYSNNSFPAPTHPAYTEISSIIREAWFSIIIKKNYSSQEQIIDRNTIEENLEPYQNRIRELLQKKDEP